MKTPTAINITAVDNRRRINVVSRQKRPYGIVGCLRAVTTWEVMRDERGFPITTQRNARVPP